MEEVAEAEELSRQRALNALMHVDMSSLPVALKALVELAAQAFAVDRASVWRREEGANILRCEDMYLARQRRHEHGRILHAADFPSYFDALAQQRVIAAGDARRDPRTRELVESYLIPYEVSAMLDVGVWLHGEMIGVLCLEEVGLARTWSADAQALAAHIADVVALAYQAEEHRDIDKARCEMSKAHHALEAETRRRTIAWHTVVSSITDAVWVVDSNGEYLFANDAACMLVGVPATRNVFGSLSDQIDQLDLYDLAGHRLSPAAWPAARALRGDTVHGVVLRMVSRRTGSEKYVRLSATTVDDLTHALRRAVVIASDVTEEERFERLKHQFLTTAAHELKTPLAIVKAYAQLLGRAEPDGEVRRYADAIDRGISRLDRLVTDLVDVAALDRLQVVRAPLDLAALAREVTSDVAKTSPHHRFDFADQAATTLVEGDYVRLEQVLIALLDNAIKFSEPGGSILVTITSGADRVTVSVRDRGAGIPLAEQSRVFEAGFRGGRPGAGGEPGLGMGLYLAHQIAARHGGTLTLDSVEGQGSTFHLALPRLASA